MRKSIVPLLCLFVSLALADWVSWHGGAGDNDWYNPANWNSNRVPNGQDSVWIPEGMPACIVPAGSTIHVRHLKIDGDLSSYGDMGLVADEGNVEVESLALVFASGRLILSATQGELINRGSISSPTGIEATGVRVLNDSSGRIWGTADSGAAVVVVYATGEVDNRGWISGDESNNRGADVVVGSDGDFINTGTAWAGNGIGGGNGGRATVHVQGRFENEGAVLAGSCTTGVPGWLEVFARTVDNRGLLQSGRSILIEGGNIRVVADTFWNFDSLLGGNSDSARGGSVSITTTGDCVNAPGAVIYQGDGMLQGGVILTGPMVSNGGTIGRSNTGWGTDSRYHPELRIHADHVSNHPSVSAAIWGDTALIVGRNMDLGGNPSYGIFGEQRVEVYLVPGGILNASLLDTFSLRVGADSIYLHADSIVPPDIGWDAACNRTPVILPADTGYVAATASRLGGTGFAGGAGALLPLVFNLSVTTRAVNWSVSSSRGWVTSNSGTTGQLEPFASEDLVLPGAIPQGVAAGETDTVCFVVSVNGFTDSLVGYLYCLGSPQVGIAESPPNAKPGLALRVQPSLFRAACRIQARPGSVVEVFDVLGNRVTRVEADRSGNCSWRPEERVRNGIYLVRAKAGARVETQRVVYLR